MVQKFTVVIVVKENRILLGFKKTKIGAGLWNGFGGKIEKGENNKQSAIRELKEETGLIAIKIEEKGLLEVSFRDTSDSFLLFFFRVDKFIGRPVESNEMIPKWFDTSEIPYSEMWEDDRHWLPGLLEGRDFKGSILFDNLKNRKLLNYEINFDELISRSVGERK